MSKILLDSFCDKGIGNQIYYGNRNLRRDMHHHIKLGGKEAHEELSSQLSSYIGEYDELINKDLHDFNKLLRESNIANIIVAKMPWPYFALMFYYVPGINVGFDWIVLLYKIFKLVVLSFII